MWGTDDNFVKPDAVRQVLASAPTIQLQTVGGGGHLLALDEPDVVAAAVTDFLGSNG